jgi:predicted phage terminase large subunit-like protein
VSVLRDFREVVGDAVWASQYQQRPAPAGGGLVKVDWFRRYDDGDLPKFDHVFQSWDTANTVKNTSAYSVCTTWGVKGKHLWLLNVLRRRMIYPDLKRAVIAQADLHDAAWVLVEDQASGTQILQELRQEGFGKLRAIKPVHDKETRMVNQTAIIEAGRVQDYLHELSVFPNGRYFDQIDSTSQALASVNTWTGGRAFLELIRQEQETKREHDEEILVLEATPGTTRFSDIEGINYRPQPDGYFYLTRVQAGPVVVQQNWKIIRTIPAGTPY